MSDTEVKSENKFALLFRSVTSSPEKKFFTLFIALSIISWSAGIASLQVHEAQVKREAAAVKLAEEKAKKDRLTKLDSLWAKSKYANWNVYEYGINYKFDSTKQCQGSRSCAYGTFVSKFNCDMFVVTLNFVSTSGGTLSSVTKSEPLVSSIEPVSLYFESTKSGAIKYVDFGSIKCEGQNY